MTGERAASLGFVGLGRMGRPMAVHLLGTGRPLWVHDTRGEAVDELVRQGATGCLSPKMVADRADTVFVSLPTPDVVEAVACGPDGLVEGATMRTFVDLSTTGQVVEQRVASRLRAAGIACVDAPVSGGPAGAQAATLTVMVAGDRDVVADLRPLLETIGGRIFVVGTEPGQAQIAKVANNLLSASAVLITAEATALGVKAGLNARTLLEIFTASSGTNAATADKFPRQVLTRAFNHGFALRLMAKDLRLCLADARRLGVPMVGGATVAEVWSVAAAQTAEDADMMEIVQLIEAWAHTVIVDAEAPNG